MMTPHQSTHLLLFDLVVVTLGLYVLHVSDAADLKLSTIFFFPRKNLLLQLCLHLRQLQRQFLPLFLFLTEDEPRPNELTVNAKNH